MTELEMGPALAEVRQAYRTVVLYQRRINEIFRRVDQVVEKEGLEFQSWCPNRYCAPLRAKKQKQFLKWAWDLSPGYCLSATWQDGSGSPLRRLWLGLDTDTAYDASKKRSGEPDPTLFAPVSDDASQTELWFSLYTSQSEKVDWGAVWRESLTPEARWKRATDKTIPWSLGDQSGTFTCRRVGVEKLISAEAVSDLLLKPITAALQKHRPERTGGA